MNLALIFVLFFKLNSLYNIFFNNPFINFRKICENKLITKKVKLAEQKLFFLFFAPKITVKLYCTKVYYNTKLM